MYKMGSEGALVAVAACDVRAQGLKGTASQG